MGDNKSIGQIKGPFSENQEIITSIVEPNYYVKQIGISTKPLKSYFLIINGEEYEIGYTGMYEIGNTKITSLYFLQDMEEDTIIDYVLKEDN